MKLRRLLIFVAIGIGNIPVGIGQCPTVDFSLPANACSLENIQLVNASQPGTLTWDFCAGDFNNTPTTQTELTLSEAVGKPSMEFAKDGNTWFAFVTGTYTNTLFRLEYLNGINNAPTSIQNLGDVGGKLNGSAAIRIIKNNGNWFGLVHNTANGELLKISFGSNLSNAIQGTTSLITGVGTFYSGFDVEYNDVDGWVCVISTQDVIDSKYKYKVLRLGPNLTAPTAGDILTTPTDPAYSVLGDVDLIKQCDQWFGYAGDVGNGNVYRLSFGTSLFQQPTIALLTNIGLPNFGRLRAMQEGEEYFLALTTFDGSFFKINLGNDLAVISPVIENEGNFGSACGLAVAKDNSYWNISIVNLLNGVVSTVKYSQPCTVNKIGNDPDAPVINYPQSGNYLVSQTLTTASGISSTTTKPISISSAIAPDIGITAQNICVNHDILFTPVNTSGTVTDYDWDFGDTNSSTQSNPTHQYSANGVYQIELEVTASSTGCKNLAFQSLTTYNQPVADFTTPSVSPICTNQNFIFDNTSTVDIGSVPTWEWRVNGSLITSNEDLAYAFSSTSNQEIRLKALIPGCENEMIKNINTLVDGPLANFSFAGQCEDDIVTFTNSTSGTVTGYAWDFDDATSSTNANPTHAFSDIGTYDVTLTASNLAGCNNTKTKSVPIYSKPLTNFLLLPPPFSCNGTASQFNDQTPGPPDSNISTWAWNFGDAGSSQNTSTLKNPQHTYANAGNYNVSLLVTTNFSCSATLQIPVIISQSPVANFNHTATCVGVAANFTDASVGTIDGWNWTIGSTAYTTQNPTHTFVSSGNTSATLTVTATNDCIGTINKPIIVPVKLTPDFSVNRNCTNQQTVFTDITNSTPDPIISQNWIFGTLGTATGSPANFTFSNTGSIGVSVTVTTQAGCSYPASKSVSILSSPQASFTPSPLAGAPPLTVTFTNTSTNATIYQWAFHDQNNSTSAAVSPTFPYQTLGEYQPELTASNAQNCFHTTSRTIRVVVPVLDVALDGLELMEFQNGFKPAVTIFNRGNVPLINLALLLNMSGPVIREHVNAIISPNTSYRHLLSFEIPTASNIDYFCIEAEVTDITPNDNNVCLSLEQSFISFPPYPNPSKGSFQLDWIMHEAGVVNLTVMNSMGQEERVLQIESIEGLNPLIIETQGLSSGVYFVKIKYQHFTKVYRVFVSE